MKKVISIVLNNFKNDSRVLKENISLKNAGYKVQVVALHEEPLKEHEEVHGIAVHRVKLKTRSWSKHKSVQLLKYFEFIYKVAKEYKNSDIVHCNDLNTLPIGVIIKKLFNKDTKIVYDSHEYQTHRAGISKTISKLSFKLEKFLLPYCDKVIVVSESIAKGYMQDYNIVKPFIILNTPNYTKIEKNSYFRDKYGIKEKEKVFLYQGRISKHRGIEKLVNIFKIMPKKYHLILMGHGEELKDFLKNINESNIHIHEAVPPYKILEYTASADYGLSLIEPVSLSYEYCLPNKLFEYIMAGIPVVVNALTELKRFTEKNKIGISVNFDDNIYSLKDQLIEFANKPVENFSNNLEKTAIIYNWEEQEKLLLEIYRGLYAN